MSPGSAGELGDVEDLDVAPLEQLQLRWAGCQLVGSNIGPSFIRATM